MKLLFDANLSRKIVPMLADMFPESTQVMLAGFDGETPDEAIWDFAKERCFTIVSADFNFVLLSNRLGAPPQVIRLERMDYSTESPRRLSGATELPLSNSHGVINRS